MFDMSVDLHYNHDLYNWDASVFFLFTILVPNTNFNKSQPKFQGVPGNAELTLSGNKGTYQRKYVIFQIDEHQIHFYLIPI